ncbi:UDP-N-acetylmuramate dehydrogenase [Fibrobacter sp. UWB12]|uniref:UDP-N-acetylmuramate dehydrogenase n=1 Tax=Fibrobacter sp. UWB12 TaxID=1896203 RepID=UPI000912AE48|nr:UDP-N-acetylmuramate dehydrogenase [Fibrobacter sp. UWB12]SHK34492.1 UDP-N-acetylmuramate dehydrogenase [Fibrobacter sp. UWB12]
MIILENVPMYEHTSFKVGGPAKYFIKTESIDDIKEALQFAKERALPSYILGKGTNLLVSDRGYNGVIIQLGKFFSEITNLGNGKICVKGATPLARLARYTINEGLAGIHKLAGIPGSLGGAIYMNAGAYGQDVSQTCVEVESIDAAGNVHTRHAADCKFAYRHSIFQELAASVTSAESAETILSAAFQLTPAIELGKTVKDIENEMQECMTKRRNSQPLSMPNAGSTFKRLDAGAAATPTQIAPGYYIEQAGLKGFRIGGAEVSRVHANFIVNVGGATAADIKALSEYVQNAVAQKFGIQLKREIILLGKF